MSRISLELVPDSKQIENGIHHLQSIVSGVSAINIPDLPDKFSVRSWEACATQQLSGYGRIAHIRASDCNPDQPLPFANAVNKGIVTELLVVSGDPPNSLRKQYHVTVFEVLKRIRNEFPTILVYAALDPYRISIQSEIMYMERKIEAGFDGLFTQPFFSLNLLRVYQELLLDTKIYWGLCPVITDGSRSYWEKRNKVLFPNNFKATLDWNIKFGRDFLKFVNETGGNTYIMPIRIPLQTYLPGIFE